jgi:hypothetical protein
VAPGPRHHPRLRVRGEDRRKDAVEDQAPVRPDWKWRLKRATAPRHPWQQRTGG